MFYNMISSYYLFKLLKRKNMKDCNRKPSEDFLISSQQMCRVCLKLGTVPIYGDKDISRAIRKFGNIEIDENDDYPKHICVSCYNMLKGAILFQQKAMESDTILKKISKQKRDRNSSYTNVYSLPSSSKHISEQEKKLNVTRNISHQNIDTLQFDDDRLSPPSPSLSENFSYVCSEYSDDNETECIPQRISKVRCKTCKKVMLKGSAKNHLDIHSQTKKYVCEVCGKSYSQKSAYYTHSFTHSTNFAYKCNKCPYRSNTAGNLKSHMRTHIRDYKYVCSECPNRFLTKSNLNKHIKTHKGRNFKCNDCDKSYFHRSQLKIHIEVAHLGIKNHTCDLCGRVFGYRKRMLDHQLRVHKRQRMKYGRIPLYLQVNPEAQDQAECQTETNDHQLMIVTSHQQNIL